jgi:hypothetical protein
MKCIITALMLSLLITPSFACNLDGTSGIVEDNDLFIPVDSFRNAGLNEEQFNAVIEKIEQIYSPIVVSLGAKLVVNRKWTDGTANANASRMGKKWNVNMYGGLARHETITEDGFALVLCHEVGHLVGGAPSIGTIFGKPMANEGQADYFAATKCLRKTFLNDDNSTIVSLMTVPATLSSACMKAFPNKAEQNICIRTGMAGASVADFFAAIKKLPVAKFDTPDPAVVSSTFSSHPAHQCRLDTYFQGSLCEVSFNEDVDSEKMKDEVKGTCHPSLGFTSGLRPLCWFKPKI